VLIFPAPSPFLYFPFFPLPPFTTAVEFLRQQLEHHRELLARRSHAQVKVAKSYGADITLPETSDFSEKAVTKSSLKGGKGKTSTTGAGKKETKIKDGKAKGEETETNSVAASSTSTRNTRRKKQAEIQKEKEEDDEEGVEESEDEVME